MLNFKTYQSLTKNKKAELLWLQGVQLGLIRRAGKMYAELYALGSFYVEIFFDNHDECPLYIKSFEKTNGLDPYLQGIDISEVNAWCQA